MVFHSGFHPGASLSEGGIDKWLVKGGKGGLKEEVVHWDAGKDHVNPGGLVIVLSVPGVQLFVCGNG